MKNYYQAKILKITKRNRNVIYITDFQKNLFIEDWKQKVYATKCTFTSIVKKSGFSIDNSTVEIFFDKLLTAKDYESEQFNDAKYELYIADLTKFDKNLIGLSKNLKLESVGILGNSSLKINQMTLELRGLKQKLIQTVVKQTSRYATDFYKKIDLSKITYTAKLTNKNSLKSFHFEITDDKPITEVFRKNLFLGYIEIKKGQYKNYKFDIAKVEYENNSYSTGIVYLKTHLNLNLDGEILVNFVSGCDNTKESFVEYGILDKYDGFPRIPTKSTIYEQGLGMYSKFFDRE